MDLTRLWQARWLPAVKGPCQEQPRSGARAAGRIACAGRPICVLVQSFGHRRRLTLVPLWLWRRVGWPLTRGHGGHGPRNLPFLESRRHVPDPDHARQYLEARAKIRLAAVCFAGALGKTPTDTAKTENAERIGFGPFPLNALQFGDVIVISRHAGLPPTA